ncbi:hypothetical protein SAMN02949497_1695 [Methylomagnum ishizawai]|uniref:GTPase-associated system helical domain-containing protein n=2 Tax=Methylomagnum ishizawai TaxID=1760988 RepID=A0A1Y6D1D7_9GAMM|nr:hypothetical protein SAMN02949497_1695 [Methylomagnum ishizawai]
MVEIQNKLGEEMETFLADLTNAIKNKLASQVQTVQETLWAEQTRLNSLWWSEALYSPSLRCGYREIPPELAATIMAFDLLAEVSKPTPASVAHLLAETVNRLPGAGFDRKQGFRDWLLEICKTRDQFPQAVLKDLIPPPDEGRLSLRDAVVLALGKNPDVDAALRRTGISDDAELSLPVFSRALFRQEQAVRLAGGRA